MLLFLGFSVFSREVAVIPKPSQVENGKGTFLLNEKTTLVFDENNPDLSRIAGFLNEHLKGYYGFQLRTEKRDGTGIQLVITDTVSLGNEGYLMEVGEKKILIAAAGPAGIFYGIQSLKQLIPVAGTKRMPLTIASVTIRDQPRFGWRGMHLDVSRHFFPVPLVKRYIDYLAMYKLNTFHWHLTDDQGWRVEIKKYPELTAVSSWRDATVKGHQTEEYGGFIYGGFYTQDQIREIVKYAADRYITIVPEIEMPGHAVAALAAFPGIGCTGGPYKVETKWGIFHDVFCAGNEQTFNILEGVLEEVCELFPSTLIHIGGDECPKDRWKECPLCQKRIRDEGLKDAYELQSYFIRRMEKYLNAKGRQIIGWDEILEGGLAPGASVMSWRGEKGGIEAAKMGHPVVMTPSSHLYFIYYHTEDRGKEPKSHGAVLPLEKVYSYEPIPAELNAEESRLILGAQGCLWAEYIASSKMMEYMLFPRICALSEIVWSPREQKNFDSFEERMKSEYPRLDVYNINYRDYRK